MSKSNQGFNSVIVVLAVGAIGCFLIIWPLDHLLDTITLKIRAGQNWVPIVAGIAYMLGFFATRVVQDGFDAIFGMAPFSDIGVEVAPGKKHPRWADSLLKPLGYFLFLLRVTVSVALVGMVVYVVIWLFVGERPIPPPPAP